MNGVRPYLFCCLFFGGIFLIFFFFWRLNPPYDFSDFDNRGFYHDSFYRAGIVQPFDFRHTTTFRLMDTYYSPFVTILFNSLLGFFGLRPWPFYFFVTIVHCANSLLVFFIASSLTHQRTVALLSAAIFLFYPTNMQTLTWLAPAITYVPMTLFGLGFLFFFTKFLEKKRGGSYGMSLFLFLGACFCKVAAVGLMPTALFLDLLLYGKEFHNAQARWFEKVRDWYEKYVPHLFVSLAFLAIATYQFPTGETAQAQGGIILGDITFLRGLEFTTRLFFPFYLMTNRPFYLAVATLGFLILLLLWGNSLLRFLTLWILISLLPFLSYLFRDIAQNYRHFYMSSIPFSILVSYLFFQVAHLLKRRVQPHAS